MRRLFYKQLKSNDKVIVTVSVTTLFFIFITLIQFTLATPAYASKSVEDLRADFLQAEKLILHNRDAEYLELADQLKNYPLYPYLHYQWLKKNLDQNRAIENFLLTYHDTRYAGLLKNKWIVQLGKDKNWKELVKHYRSTSSAEIQCYYNLAQYHSGHKKSALIAAKKIWVVGRSQPAACDPLFKALLSSRYFTREMIWQRFHAALANGNVALANYVKGLLGPKDEKIAALWIKVHRQPELVVTQKDWHGKYKQAGLIFAHAVQQVAKGNSTRAAEIWDAEQQRYTIPNNLRRRIERKLALGLAFRREKQAYSRLKKLPKSDNAVREWQIRTALNEQNWLHINESLAALTVGEKKETNWQYWQARVFEQAGETEQANQLYAKLANDRSLYGFLAATRLGRDFVINGQPVAVTEQEVAVISRRPDMQMVIELLALNRGEEAKRQWWYTVARLNRKQVKAAAKLAQQWEWEQVAIFTIARAKYWDDVGLRFPIKYRHEVELNAAKQQLDPSIVYGIIRRESAFDENARSPVGARGLMQIMPKTGRQIARELKEKWRSESILNDPVVNVKYGAYYYKQLLKQFDGHYALAAAAYNAGPHRVKKWLPEEKPVPADIWIETIPFKETRGYVAAVLTYALIYQERMKRNALKIRDFMRDVFPG
jgi:peptidoglycan lytic transglycosylase